jgi:hypothetical protein
MRRVTFDRPGLSRIFCNIHPGMAAYVMAVPSSYFAVSDDQGTFAITSVPQGSFTYRAWRPGGTKHAGTIAVGTDTALAVQWP